jgi:large subunit ribosomal protein L6
MSSSRTTTAFMPILKRSFHASTSRRSHIGSLPITLPQSVTLSLPPTSISPTLPPSSPLAQRLVTVTGPLGTQTLPILPPIILSNNGQGLSVSVHDSEEKSQRSLWGLTRSLIHNAIKGVSEGYKVDLRLVGVGYRGAVEPIPKVFLDLQSQMPRIARPSKPGAPPYVLPPLPTERLNMKLGYAHPVLIDIPAGITVTTPAPTKIVLSGTDKQKLGLFAAKIRRWRKPEPYRGKVSHTSHMCLSITNDYRVSLLATRQSSSRRSRRSSQHAYFSPPPQINFILLSHCFQNAFCPDSSGSPFALQLSNPCHKLTTPSSSNPTI